MWGYHSPKSVITLRSPKEPESFSLIRDSLPSLPQLRQNPVYLLLSQILVVRLIYLHHRRGAAGVEALDGEQGEFAVGERPFCRQF
jgi:hypothetical protein